MSNTPVKVNSDLNTCFSKQDTLICKAIAVCLLLFHHLYMGVLPAPMSLFGNLWLTVFATLSKVCVAIFTILSGYGLSISYSKKQCTTFSFMKKRLISLFTPFWLVYVIFFILSMFFAREGFTISDVYGFGFDGFRQTFYDFLALRPIFGTATLNQTWWYMEAILMLYLTFPFLYYLCKKVPYLLFLVSAIPLILYYFLGNNEWDTCRELYWFFPFSVGIFIAQRHLFDKYAKSVKENFLLCIILTFIMLLVCVFIRSKIGLAFDTFFAIAIILFIKSSLCVVHHLNTAFSWLGFHSGNIFLIHSFFYYNFTSHDFFLTFLWNESVYMQLIAFPLLLFISFICSVFLNAFSKLLLSDR